MGQMKHPKKRARAASPHLYDASGPSAHEPSRYFLGPQDSATDTSEWRPLRPGVRIRDLFKGPDLHIALLSYIPGACVPMHVHTGDEHIFVVQGSQSDEQGDYPAGSYIFNPAGTSHSVQSEEGCLVLIQWRSPVAFIDDNPIS
ncbi:dimethylsulfonioproprionate lyase family protein [Acidiferrobacter sp.]|uniref:dimethylsulfonioproprionate lyase family protein n=1 Tax=Acidiferrobacter sp. TaxID=1872107 RepID=UPI00261B1D59|nr:dimethylsulfonioproprionate lyase family protein [Acidiferrobacter sp.]